MLTTKKINLAQLDAELNAGGLNMESIDGEHTISAIDDKITDAQLKAAIDAHVAQEDAEPSIVEKLASVGVSVDDLKVALGL
jgi:3-dehydroquinate dehydratase